jgi:hypothetical protein
MAETVETKVNWSGLGAIGAGALIAVLNWTVGNSELLGGLPPWLQFIVVTLVPGVVAWLSGYAKKSTTSTASAGFRS